MFQDDVRRLYVHGCTCAFAVTEMYDMCRLRESDISPNCCTALQSESLSQEFCFQGESWHKHKLWLAFNAGLDQVFVHDFGDTGN